MNHPTSQAAEVRVNNIGEVTKLIIPQ